MLEGLDQIEWTKLRHMHGPATDVPVLLRRLTWRDGDVQRAAFDELSGLLFHQFSVYSATAAAVPFLLPRLVDPSFTLRQELLEFLSLIASLGGDHDEWRATQQDPEMLERQIDEIVESRRTATMNVAGYRAAIRDGIVSRHHIYAAVREGLPIYWAMLNDDAPSIRICAVELLSVLDEDYAGSLSAVRAQLEVEQDEEVLAVLVDKLQLFSDASPWCLALCTRLLRTHASPQVRLGAANTLVQLYSSTAPSEAIVTLARAYAGRDEDIARVWPLHINTPYDSSSNQWKTAAGIQGLNVEQIAAMAEIMLRGLEDTGPHGDWLDYGHRVERLCTLLFAVPATCIGTDLRLDGLRQLLIAIAYPVLISHLAVGPQAWTASYSAEVLLHLAYPCAARLLGPLASQNISDLRTTALAAVVRADFWPHTLDFLPLIERVLTTVTAHRDEYRPATVRAEEQALLAVIKASVWPDAPIRPHVEAAIARYADLLA